MAKCEIVLESRPVVGPLTSETLYTAHSLSVPYEVVGRCQTHGMPVQPSPTDATTMCPIGRIEEATEQALKAIADAKGQPC